MKHVIVGTAGHIDHGKSALIRALTGVDPDRLKEEKLRGITIDLGFAHLDLDELLVAFVELFLSLVLLFAVYGSFHAPEIVYFYGLRAESTEGSEATG